jgi:hypothetical protein
LLSETIILNHFYHQLYIIIKIMNHLVLKSGTKAKIHLLKEAVMRTGLTES